MSVSQLHASSFHAMGCQMGAWVFASDATRAAARLAAARELIETAERRLSRFRADSELSRLNGSAGRLIRLSPLLWEATTHALAAAQRTGGLYDPTILDALEAAGYEQSFEALGTARRIIDRPDLARRPAGPRSATWRDIALHIRTRQVLLPPGLRLDLAGIAKAWAAERAADRLASLGPCLVDAGGDLALRGCPPDQDGWPIGVADPRRPDVDLALLVLRERGVATSGVDHRRWSRGGELQHHLIDPRTGRPAETDLLSATVVAVEAAEANLHALVAMLLGAREGLAYLNRQPDVDGLLVRGDGELLVTPGFERYVHTWSPREQTYEASGRRPA